MRYHEDIRKLAYRYRRGETDYEIDSYLDNYADKFYLYIKNDKLLGYADYYVTGNTLHIYDLICEGRLLDMWNYCKGFMKEHNIKYIEFKRSKYNKRRSYGR